MSFLSFYFAADTSIGAIIGGVIGSLLLVLIVILISLLIALVTLRKKRRKSVTVTNSELHKITYSIILRTAFTRFPIYTNYWCEVLLMYITVAATLKP